MLNIDLSGQAWDNRYKSNDIGWDLGKVSNPLKTYIDQFEDKSLKILIPGGGNSYEAEYLFKKGFTNIFVVDVSKTALENLRKRVPNFPENQLLHQDFFDMNDTFDLILEQTFFCAINPTIRQQYATKIHDLLSEKGKLVGVLFDAPLYKNRPPFGGNKIEYSTYFKDLFHFDTFEKCYNSEPSRNGKELFINLEKN